METAEAFDGNDLADPRYMAQLRERIDTRDCRPLTLAGTTKTADWFLELVNSKVTLQREAQESLVELAQTYHAIAPRRIASAEARIAVLLGIVNSGTRLYDALRMLNAQPADVLRFAAARRDFSSVKLPAHVLYDNLTWNERVQILSFLSRTSFEDLCESMGQNRTAWFRFVNHTHLVQQKDFRNRFTSVIAAVLCSIGWRQETVPPGRVNDFLTAQSNLYEVTEGGNLVFRTFASRVQAAVDKQDFETFRAEIVKRPGHLIRNIGSLSNVCTPDTQPDFVRLVSEQLSHASTSVLLSVLQIDLQAKFRIIDSKGNTTVTEASYSPVIGEIQSLAEEEIRRRHGLPGRVRVAARLRNRVVPFLSTNAELDRGSRIAFDGAKYLYFLMHWVQQENRRTDLDHSYVCLDADWNAETIYFGNQANAYINQSGDITSAAAPKGGTEYGRISLQEIPPKVRYIVPIINVYSGDVFSENATAYAGFMFSDSTRFSLKQEHTRYDLNQPANSNIPFVVDMAEQEIVVVDFNNRRRNGLTAHASIPEIRKVISALRTKKIMTLERFARMLSGPADETSLTIKAKANGRREIEPEQLHSLIG